MPDYARLVETAMHLRANAPAAWELFLAAINDYSTQVNAQMVKCPPELLARAQGMAIQMAEISTVLHQAPSTYEKMRAAQMVKKNG